MREILYRGKRLKKYCKSQDWTEGVPFIDHEGDCIMKTAYSEFVVDEKTVGQYTGLTDKNGKKIFVGDIVKADDYIFVVKFGKCGGVANSENYGYMGFYLEAFSESTKLSAKYGLRDDICYFTDIEVIGNIHDYPELVKGGKEK